MKAIYLALALLPLAASCAEGPPPEQKLGAREAKALEKELAGKVAGEPVNCISSLSPDKLQVLGDNTVVYRVNKDLVYRSTLEGACRGLSMGDTLVLKRPISSQYCRGDIAYSVHAPTGTYSGSCALGDFVPYKTAGK